MRFYRIAVEGVFIKPIELEGDVGGFHATFYVMASDEKNACSVLDDALKRRMDDHGVAYEGNAAYFLVDELWEVSGERYGENSDRDYGFTFFRLTMFDSIFLMLRGLYFKLGEYSCSQHIKIYKRASISSVI